MAPRLDSSQLLELHRRLCDGDRTASKELAELILEPLVDAVSRQFSRTDEQTIWDGVVEAFLDDCSRPRQFDARRGSRLDGFLRIASRRNVINALRYEPRRAYGGQWPAHGRTGAEAATPGPRRRES